MGLKSITGSSGPDCDGCDEKTKEQIENKDPDDRSDREQAILDGEETTPRFNGPLVPNNVTHCSFCHGVGQLGALVFGVAGYGLATHFELGSAVAIGAGVWLFLALVVGIVGHFPILGPIFGPIVEDMFSGSKDEQQTATDGGKPEYDGPTIEDVDVDSGQVQTFDENNIDTESQLKQLQKENEEAWQLADMRKQYIRDLEAELEDTEDSFEDLEQKVESWKEQAEQYKEQKQNLEQLIAKDAYNGVIGSKADHIAFRPMNANAMEKAEIGGGVPGGPMWIDDIVEYYNKPTNTIHYLAYGVVGSEDKLAEIEEITDTITRSDLDGLEGQLFPNPHETDQLPTHKHPGVEGFDFSEGHRPLFWFPIPGITECRKETKSDPEFPYQLFPNILAYDLENNYAPAPFDSKGFERIQILREAKQELQEVARDKMREVEDMRNRMEALQHKVQSLEQENEDLETYKNHYRQNQLQLEDEVRSQQQSRNYQDRVVRYQDDKIDQINDEKQALKEDRDTQRRKALEESMSTQDLFSEYEDKGIVKEDQRKAVRVLRKGGWQPSQNGHIDLSKLGDPSYEYDYGDVVSMARDDPELDGVLKGKFYEALDIAPETDGATAEESP